VKWRARLDQAFAGSPLASTVAAVLDKLAPVPKGQPVGSGAGH
jgi:hypothetical protein